MEHAPHRQKPPSLQLAITLLGLALLIGVYIAAMNQLVDMVEVEGEDGASQRDLVHAYVHVGLLGLSAVVGFFLGKWFSGLGLAFATLFFIVMAVGMLLVQMGSYELACQGHNDLVRHWQC